MEDETVVDDTVEQPIPDKDLPPDEALDVREASDDVKVPADGTNLPRRE